MIVRGGWLLLIVMLGLTALDLGRSSLRPEESPAFAVSPLQLTQILLIDSSGHLDGIHQINDAEGLIDVINLAGLRLSSDLRHKLLDRERFDGGESIVFRVDSGVIDAIEFGWMPAALRMTLAIPLCVNRMTLADWDDLPGVGPSLAQRIDRNRQLNGEFTSFIELKRVKGVGKQRIKKWNPFFGKC